MLNTVSDNRSVSDKVPSTAVCAERVLCVQFLSPDGSIDDLHDALVDALTDVDQRSSSLSHPAQQETYNTPMRPGQRVHTGVWAQESYLNSFIVRLKLNFMRPRVCGGHQ